MQLARSSFPRVRMPSVHIGVVTEATAEARGECALWSEYARADFSTPLLASPTLQKAGYYTKAMHALVSPSVEMWWETPPAPASWEVISGVTI